MRYRKFGDAAANAAEIALDRIQTQRYLGDGSTRSRVDVLEDIIERLALVLNQDQQDRFAVSMGWEVVNDE